MAIALIWKMHSAWIYILTNEHNTTLYVGITNDLPTRLWEHRTKQNPKSFTAKYNLSKLIYYEGYELITDAITREKFIKGKSRQWKIDLVETLNPEWRDLTEAISFTSKKCLTYLYSKPSSIAMIVCSGFCASEGYLIVKA